MPFNSMKAIRMQICCNSLNRNTFVNVANLYLTEEI